MLRHVLDPLPRFMRPSMRLGGAALCAALAGAGVTLGARPALAQAASNAAAAGSPGVAVAPGAQATGRQQIDLSVGSLPSNQGGLADLNLATTQSGPPGTIRMTTKPPPPPSYSFADFARNIHGYVSTGVATGGGYGYSGGVEMPLVPGRADLAFGASSGQIGDLPPLYPGGKRQTQSYTSYYAGIHLHPADNVDAYISISGLQLKSPYPYGYGFGPFGGPLP
jgi:hypothetical protein